jgi:hypothetical protein
MIVPKPKQPGRANPTYEKTKYAQEDSNLQPRSGPELTTGISRPLCQLSYGRS